MPSKFLAILILLIIFPACAQLKTGASPQTSVHDPGQVKPPLLPGDHPKTIDAYKADYAKNPQDQALLRDYVKTLEEIKIAADRAMEREDLVSAGKNYNILLKNYKNFKTFAHMLSFDRDQLNTKNAACKTALSKKGFQEYRQGNLSEAIALWQDYLVIDPNNADVKNALNTAKLQQKNLKQKK